MLRRLRPRSVYDVLAALAFFVAMAGGTAYAANTIGSSDVIDDSLLSQDVKNGTLKAVDLADESIGTAKISAGGVKNADIADSAVTSVKVQNDSLTGADINESTLDVGAAALPTAVSSDAANCSADDGTPEVCTHSTVNLPRPGRLAVAASGVWFTYALDDTVGANASGDATDAVRGYCELRVDGTVVGSTTSMGEVDPAGDEPTHPPTRPDTLALVGLSPNVGAGSHTVDLACTEADGDIDWDDLVVTAVEVAPSG